MEMMLRRDPITGIYENVPVPEPKETVAELDNFVVESSEMKSAATPAPKPKKPNRSKT